MPTDSQKTESRATPATAATSTTATKPTEPVQKWLTELESALDTPSMPGEMPNWAATLRKFFDDGAREFLRQMDTVHAAELKDIEGQDPELSARVRALREDDRRNREWCVKLTKAVADFERRAAAAGADEKQVLEQHHVLVEDALQFVVHARKQEVAIRTWTQESFARDTGAVD
jgi:hypothetical protein